MPPSYDRNTIYDYTTAQRTHTITRINPDLPVCWEDADTLRVGFERAEARVHAPSAGAQRLLSMLCIGVTSTSISRTARTLGTSPAETRRLLHALKPTLQEETISVGAPSLERPPRLRAALFDNGIEVPGLREALGAGSEWTLGAPVPPEMSDLVFHVERYLEPLEFAQRWQGARVPHVIVRYSDRAVHVGPLIDCAAEKSASWPCHSCLSLRHVEDDARVPALAAQLCGKRPQSESADSAEMTVALIALLVRQWLRHDSTAHITRYIVPMTHGRISGLATTETVAAHPDCGCQGLEQN